MWEAKAKLKTYRNIFKVSLFKHWHQSFVHFPIDRPKMIKWKECTRVLYHSHAFRAQPPAQVMISSDATGWEVGKCVTWWVNVESSSDCSRLRFPAHLTNLLLFACCSRLQMSSSLTTMHEYWTLLHLVNTSFSTPMNHHINSAF